jgi:quercetin dioxygenase-like cupin family protein
MAPEKPMTFDGGRALVRIGAIEVRSVIDAAASNGTHTVIEVIVRPGGQMPAPHSHDGFEETFLGLEGLVTVIVGGHEHRLAVGEAVCIKRGQVHGFRNDTEHTVRFIGIAAPGVFGWPYFQEMAEAFASFGDGPPDKAMIGEIMRRHGLTPAMPPAT